MRGALLLVVGALGCGDSGAPDGGPPRDAGPADGGPARPVIPWLAADGTETLEIAPPALAPCPAGWREVAAAGEVTTCEPFPETGPADCGPGEAHFPGETGCAPVGAPCPTGPFPDDLPDDGSILYVLAGATGGDGSRASPYGRIGDALGRAASGMTVALGRGRYDEVVSLRAGVALAGACAEATVLSAAATDPRPAVINVTVAGAAVRDLRIEGSARAGISVSGTGAELDLAGVVVDEATLVGVAVEGGARLTAERLVIRGTRPDGRGALGRGLNAQFGATAEVRRALIDANKQLGVFASEGSTLRLEDAAVRDTDSQPADGGNGRGVGVQTGAHAELRRVLLERNRENGVHASGEATSIVLEDVVIRDTAGQRRDGAAGRGISLELGPDADVRRVLIERNHDYGIFAGGAGTVLLLQDAIVRETRSREADATAGRGLAVEDGADATVRRVVSAANRDVGLFVSRGGVLLAEDVVVRDTEGREVDQGSGRGISVQAAARADVARALVDGNREVGIQIDGEGSSILLADVIVRSTRGNGGNGTFGRSLNVQFGAHGELRRALLDSNREVAIAVGAAGATLFLQDVVVRDTGPRQSDGLGGRGLIVQDGGEVSGGRLAVERSRDIGLFASGGGTSILLTDVTVSDVVPDGAGLAGTGAGAYLGASLELERFLVTRCSLVGVQVAREGTVDLHDGEVSGNAIGANVQNAGFDLARLMDRVVFRDNGRNLDAAELPVPDPALGPADP